MLIESLARLLVARYEAGERAGREDAIRDAERRARLQVEGARDALDRYLRRPDVGDAPRNGIDPTEGAGSLSGREADRASA